MANTKRTGKSTTFTLGGTSIGNIKEISGPSMTRDQIDVTDFSSPGGYREYIPALRDAGEVTMTITYNPSSSADLALRSNFESDNVVACQINLAGSNTYLNFSGSVSSMGLTIPLDDVITQEIGVRVSGQVTVSGSTWS